MDDVTLVVQQPVAFIVEVEATTPLEIVEVVIPGPTGPEGPIGPVGPEAPMNADLVAYFTLANS